MDDLFLIRSQEDRKRKSHASSAKYQARGKTTPVIAPIQKGQLVYIHSDRDKLRQRDRYIVKEISDDTCKVQKFSGSQLRARTYTVNRANISVVPSWRYTGLEDISDDEEDKVPGAECAADLREEEVQDDVFVDDSQSEDDEEVEDVPAKNTRTRSGRSVRPPSYLGDYVRY